MANTYATWDATHKSSYHTLSNGNLTIDATSGNGQTRATISLSTGKWYWEISVTAATAFVGGGVANSSALTSVQPGADASLSGFWVKLDTNWYFASSDAVAVGDFAAGDICAYALDMDARTLKLYKNNSLLATVTSTKLPAGDLFPIFGNGSTFSPSATITANFGATALTYTPPTGYNAGVYTSPATVIQRRTLGPRIGSRSS